jgi:hypothetical protein
LSSEASDSQAAGNAFSSLTSSARWPCSADSGRSHSIGRLGSVCEIREGTLPLYKRRRKRLATGLKATVPQTDNMGG